MIVISDRISFRLSVVALVLAWCVVMLGAYTRLKGAGLGCPDWPGCYGQLVVPETAHALQQAVARYPMQPVEAVKAWAEMVHRYAAGTLATLILLLALRAVWRFRYANQPKLVPFILVGVVIFQALLGMWTVTWRLLPQVVMGHLLGGMTIVALLGLLVLQLSVRELPKIVVPQLRFWAALSLGVLVLQIVLGGWTSANYAALVCPDFPTCHGDWVPDLDFARAFYFWGSVGPNYQGGLLDNVARMTIQFTHRVGALVTFLVVGSLVWRLMWTKNFRRLAKIIFILLLIQVSLGILNVVLVLPLPNAVLHNGVAVLLLLSLVATNYFLYLSAKQVKQHA